MHLTTLSSWATLLMCAALALLMIWICANAGRHRKPMTPPEDWHAIWGDER